MDSHVLQAFGKTIKKNLKLTLKFYLGLNFNNFQER